MSLMSWTVRSVVQVALLSSVLAAEDIPKTLEKSSDPTYGLTEANPVKVGQPGPRNADAYLTRLKGPNGERVRFKRLGSCCPFKTPHALIGGIGLLDKYEVSYDGLQAPITIMVNGYDFETPKIPVGFTQ